MLIMAFNYFKEVQPTHNQDIIRLIDNGHNVELVQTKAEYKWEEINENGEPTGVFCCYCLEDTEAEDLYRLVIQDVEGRPFTDDSLWMLADVYLDLTKFN